MTLRVMAWNIDGAVFVDEATHDIARDFGASTNPGGVWTYGYSVEGGANYALIPFDNTRDNVLLCGAEAWSISGYNTRGAPTVWRNLGPQYKYGVPVGKVSLHPGPRPNGDHAVLRFTAPPPPIFHNRLEAPYHVTGQFFAGDTGRMNARVVWKGDFDSPLMEFNETTDASTFELFVRLAPGETLDFVVGNNGDFTSGNTPLDVRIDAVGQLEKLGNIAEVIRLSNPDLVY